MATEIVTYGVRHGDLPIEVSYLDGARPSVEIGSVRFIDVRRMGLNRNPYHDRRLRGLRGTDPAVAQDVARTPGFEHKYAKIRSLVLEWPGPVWIGCTGGHHRSVAIGERLARDLGVPVTHRDLKKT